jgi:hypothetical protein
MRNSVTSIWMLAVVVCLGACGCSGAQGLVGLWQTETVRMTVANRTNILESYETVEFLKDGSFKMASGISTDGDKRTGVIFRGTYALIDTNHVRLEVASNQARPSYKVPLTVRFSIVGSELEMEKLIPSVVPETQKYRRVKR